jgi:hypothetical protein
MCCYAQFRIPGGAILHRQNVLGMSTDHNYLFESADHEYHFRFVKGLDMGAWEVIRKYPNTATPKCAPTRSGVVRSTSELV